MEISKIDIKDWAYAQALEWSKEAGAISPDDYVVTVQGVEMIIDKIVAHFQVMIDRKEAAFGHMMKECEEVRAEIEKLKEPKTCEGCAYHGVSRILMTETCSCVYSCKRAKITLANKYKDYYTQKGSE